MELKKQFTFSGKFKKFHEEDTKKIEISNANIYCYTNGSIFIEINSEVNQNINHKRFFESVPTYGFKDMMVGELDPLQFLLYQSDKFEKEVVQKSYKGDYEIEGKTFEGWEINAIIADANGLNDIENVEQEQEDKYQVRLRDLKINYDLQSPEEGQTQEIVYGLANIEIIQSFSANIGNLEAEMYIEPISTGEGTHRSGVLSAEMTLRNISENQQDSYENYSAWFASLLSLMCKKIDLGKL